MSRFVHRIRIRYGECDMQGVVFNAHYLAYCDDAMEVWFRALGLELIDQAWDVMLKKAVVEWHGPARAAEELDIAVGVDRWGTTSFDVGFAGSVGDRPVFDATITYVGVVHGTTTTAPPPDAVRAALDDGSHARS